MVEKTEAYKCDECSKTFTSESAAENCNHKRSGKVYGDPVAVCE